MRPGNRAEESLCCDALSQNILQQLLTQPPQLSPVQFRADSLRRLIIQDTLCRTWTFAYSSFDVDRKCVYTAAREIFHEEAPFDVFLHAPARPRVIRLCAILAHDIRLRRGESEESTSLQRERIEERPDKDPPMEGSDLTRSTTVFTSSRGATVTSCKRRRGPNFIAFCHVNSSSRRGCNRGRILSYPPPLLLLSPPRSPEQLHLYKRSNEYRHFSWFVSLVFRRLLSKHLVIVIVMTWRQSV